MVHRTVLGAMERFVGCLIEHYAGDFPLWIAPIQMRILPITDAHIDYAKKLQAQLLLKNFRVECDTGSSKINYKIREGIVEKFPIYSSLETKRCKVVQLPLEAGKGETKGCFQLRNL